MQHFYKLRRMKKFVWILCTLYVFLIACSGQKTEEAEVYEDPQENNATLENDSLAQANEEDALPARADELFDDFLFNYSQDSTVQMRRTAFPLPYYKENEKEEVARSEWKKDPLFSTMDFYSVLFTNQNEMELEKDTALNRVQMEYLYLDKKSAKRYNFLRNPKGFWILYKIVEEPFNEQRDPVEFLSFYERFATDSLFQREHVAEEVNFITFDPDDEFKTVECGINVDQWFAFKPELPTDLLTQVNYGQNVSGLGDKVINFRGNSNGFNNTLTFKRKNDTWILTSFEDTSE